MADEKQKKSGSIMRAATKTERAGDMIRNAYESLAEQPLAKISDLLGYSDFPGVINEFTDPEAAERVKGSALPMGPGKGLTSIGRSRGVVRPSSFGLKPTEIASTHPALPPEFNMTRPSRTGPVNMNEMPSGKMEYLDPDVAEYMNPTRPDPTTLEGQRRLRFLTGK